MKKLRLFLFTLIGFLCIDVMNTKALERNITSFDDFKAIFNETDITVGQSNITLNNDVAINDTLNFKTGNYTLDLNGKKLSLSGKITVAKDVLTVTTDDYRASIFVDENKTLDIIGGVYNCLIENYGTLTIDGAEISNIDNSGESRIKSGKTKAYFMNEETGTMIIDSGDHFAGGNAGDMTINGGTYSSLNIMVNAITKLTGGVFKTRDNEIGSIILEKNGYTYEEDINLIVEDLYEAKYSNYSNNNSNTELMSYGIYTSFYNDVQIVKSVDNYSDIFKKITTTDTWTVNAFKPKQLLDTDFLLSAVASDLINDKNYMIYASSRTSFDIASIDIINNETNKRESHKVKVIYNQPPIENREKVDNVLSKMKTTENFDEREGYMLDDLYLINYFNVNNQGFETENGNAMALNFAKDLINAINGSNIHFKFDPRLGNGGNGLFEYAGGQAIVYYDGIAHTSTNADITVNHVLYIPSDTENTTEAYIEAATKRIKDYLGAETKITVTKGGLFTTIDNYNELELIDETTSGDYYFNIKFGDVIQKFAICKKDANKLETPKYLASDIMSNIMVKSDDTSIPLDASIKAESVESEEIEEAIGTSIYAAYDISLYSNSKKANITDLKNGKFLVSIPVTEELKDKNVTVYYITSEGKKEEHVATVKDGFATFETEHFSTYILTEKMAVNPNTIDDVGKNITIGLLSLLGIICASLYVNKKVYVR